MTISLSKILSQRGRTTHINFTQPSVVNLGLNTIYTIMTIDSGHGQLLQVALCEHMSLGSLALCRYAGHLHLVLM